MFFFSGCRRLAFVEPALDVPAGDGPGGIRQFADDFLGEIVLELECQVFVPGVVEQDVVGQPGGSGSGVAPFIVSRGVEKLWIFSWGAVYVDAGDALAVS